LIASWFKQGAKSGDTSKLNYSEILNNSFSKIKPDLILSLDSILLKNNKLDKFYVLKIPYTIPYDTFVRAIELIPGHPDYLHHLNGHLLNYDPAKKKNVFAGTRLFDVETKDYDTEFIALKLDNDDGTLPQRIHSAVNYLPGTQAAFYPEGLGGFRMSKVGAFVANDIHFGPSPINVWDKSKLYIYFSKTPPKRPTSELMLGTNGVSPIIPPLVLQPGTITKHFSSVTIYNDISILTINPHMHLLGKSFTAYAVKPNGDTVKLIRIPDWRFKWQYFYTFKKMVKIPKGSIIIIEAVFDNTSDNPNNPFNPPQVVSERFENNGASMRTTDEMLQFIITYLPYVKGDENISLE
ncbi:MAG: hypothetical protein H7321_00740, partial [Bacteroidia bacterium]|nr:hypothetical protein [Bacteroidia bacterium]